jgi:hypothetical protein
MGAFLKESTIDGTVFERLRDPDFLLEVRTDRGVVAWPNGADLAPDGMYDAIRAKGYWALDE